MLFKFIGFSTFLVFIFSFCTKDQLDLTHNHISDPVINRISGITMVAPPDQFETNPIPAIQGVNASWISVVPYAFSPKNKPEVYYNSFGQWWGETPEGIKESVKLAHEKGLKVMLKPQVYIPNGWVGEMDFETEGEWLIWEKEYRNFILTMVSIANESNIEMLCVGTEYKIAMQKREQYWRSIIAEIKSIYKGKILYSSNWDAYEDVRIWDIVDYIGISSYFPLSDSKTPTVDELSIAWQPIIKDFRAISKQYKKPILFTEYGYLTVDQCAYKSWELEKIVKTLPINQQAQANALEALYKNMILEDFWMGGFLWKWFPNNKGHEGYIPRDYTPQEKLSEHIVRTWYAKF